MGAAPADDTVIRRLFVVDGIDGSGKSHAARRIAVACTRFGMSAALLHVDDFRRPTCWLQPGRTEPEIYYRDYFDFAALNNSVDAFLGGAASVTIPVYDSQREMLDGEQAISFRGCSILVVEGVLVRRAPAVRYAPGVYLRTSRTRAWCRIMARDLLKGCPAAEIERRISKRYFPSQDRYREEYQPEDLASRVVDNEHWDHPVLVRDTGPLPPAEQYAVEALLRNRMDRERREVPADS